MIAFPTNVRDPNFLAQLQLFNNQQGQAAANLKTHDEYVSYAATWLVSNTHQAQEGLTVTAPRPVPTQTVFNDDGTISHPPFTDLALPMLDPKTVTNTVGPGFVGVNPTGATGDMQAILLMLQHVVVELDAIKAKVQA